MERKRAFAIHSGVFHPLPACSLGDVTLQPPGSPHTSWKHFLLPLLCSSKLSLEHLACCLLLELWGVPGGSGWVFWRAFCVCVCVCVQRYICGVASNSKERFRMKSNSLPLHPSPVLKQHFWQFTSQTINSKLDSLTFLYLSTLRYKTQGFSSFPPHSGFHPPLRFLINVLVILVLLNTLVNFINVRKPLFLTPWAADSVLILLHIK